MMDPADMRFFQILRQVCAETAGFDAECQEAIDRAVETEDPTRLRSARERFDALDPAVKEGILRQVHARMATDLPSILDMMATAPGRQRPN